MEHLWKELIDCGIKSVGTPEKEKAEELLFQEFKKISPDAYKFEFTFEGWGSNEPSWLKMTSPEETELQYTRIIEHKHFEYGTQPINRKC